MHGHATAHSRRIEMNGPGTQITDSITLFDWNSWEKLLSFSTVAYSSDVESYLKNNPVCARLKLRQLAPVLRNASIFNVQTIPGVKLEEQFPWFAHNQPLISALRKHKDMVVAAVMEIEANGIPITISAAQLVRINLSIEMPRLNGSFVEILSRSGYLPKSPHGPLSSLDLGYAGNTYEVNLVASLGQTMDPTKVVDVLSSTYKAVQVVIDNIALRFRDFEFDVLNVADECNSGESIEIVRKVTRTAEKNASTKVVQDQTGSEALTKENSVREGWEFDVFLSYSTKDLSIIEKIAERLRESDVTVWFDQHEILIGESILEKIEWGLNSSRLCLVALSKNYVTSHWAMQEFQTMFTRQIERGAITVLPVLLEQCDIPSILAKHRYADIRNDFEFGMTELIQTINRVLSK
jgi:TIR domain